MLEAALFRPQTGYYADLVEEASALWKSLAQNPPFIDGNKRAAFAVTYTFLAINNLRITADAEAIYAFISGLYEARSFELTILCTGCAQTRPPWSCGPTIIRSARARPRPS